MNFGKTIKQLREEAGISPTKLAEKSGLSLAYISKLEKGQYQTLSLETSKLLADGLGFSLRDFLDKTGYLENNKTRPSLQLVTQALRSNGFDDELSNEVVRYAEYLRSRNK